MLVLQPGTHIFTPHSYIYIPIRWRNKRTPRIVAARRARGRNLLKSMGGWCYIEKKNPSRKKIQIEYILYLWYEIWNHRPNDKNNYDRNGKIVEDFFWSTTFKFTKISSSWNDRKSSSFWLDHHYYDDNKSEKKKCDMHKKVYESIKNMSFFTWKEDEKNL